MNKMLCCLLLKIEMSDCNFGRVKQSAKSERVEDEPAQGMS